MPKEITKQCEDLMNKAIDSLKKDFTKVKTGKANPTILNSVYVEYWGTPTPLNQIASISVPDPQTLMVKPFDRSLVKNIEKAILVANLGFNPNNDGEVVRIPVPPLNEATRKELVKEVKKLAEDSKITIRNLRRDAVEKLRKLEKDSVISEDALHRHSDEVQKTTDKFIANIDTLAKEKEQAILSF